MNGIGCILVTRIKKKVKRRVKKQGQNLYPKRREEKERISIYLGMTRFVENSYNLLA